jgi:hypothetical protein
MTKLKIHSLFRNDKDKSKICPFCGINTAIDDIDILEFFHDNCWIEFRKNDYPIRFQIIYNNIKVTILSIIYYDRGIAIISNLSNCN